MTAKEEEKTNIDMEFINKSIQRVDSLEQTLSTAYWAGIAAIVVIVLIIVNTWLLRRNKTCLTPSDSQLLLVNFFLLLLLAIAVLVFLKYIKSIQRSIANAKTLVETRGQNTWDVLKGIASRIRTKNV